jgi:TonB-linked SusC/RagA family outer membrane protein
MKKTVLLLAFFFCTIVLLAQRTVTGKVTDDKGNPISSASVQVKGTNIGTATQADGSYTLNVPASAKELEVSYVGLASQTIVLRSGTSFYSVSLLPSIVNNLDEVVVTGFNRAKKSDYAGAASKVVEKEIRNVPMGSFDQVLQGRVPGLVVLSGDGQPGAAAGVLLRGPTSINGGSSPLYVVDGIPVEAGVFQGINPNDFASVDVLKDATAAALYGSRGASGVIVATTKRGNAGKMKMSISSQYGIKTKPDFRYDIMSTAELLKAQEDIGKVLPSSTMDEWGNFPTLPGWQYSADNPNKMVNGVLVPKTAADFTFGNNQLDSLRRIDVNWQDEFYRNGTFSNNEVSFSGGTGKTRLYTNLGYYNEQGINKPSDMKRISLRTNLDYADDKLAFALSSSIGYTRRNFQSNELNSFATFVNPFFVPLVTPPYITPRLPNGKYNVGNGIIYSAPTQLDKTFYDKVYNDQLKGILSLSLNYNFSQSLYAGAVTGVDFRETQNTIYNDPRVYDTYTNTNVRTSSGSISEGLNRFLQVNARGYAGYKKTIKDDHDIDVTVYGEFIRYFAKTIAGTAYGIDYRTPNTLAGVTAGNAANQLFQSVTGAKSRSVIESVMGTLRYSFRNKYTLTGSYRYDGTSKLPEANRMQGFYAVGAIWNVSQENFLAGNRLINVLRLKFSYGQSANAENFPYGDFGYLPLYNTNTNLISGNIGIVPSTPGNPDAQWEYTNTANLGIEFELWKNRIYGDVQLYNKVTNNLFASLSLSATAGAFGSVDVNAGSMYNRGVEYNVNVALVRSKNLTWIINANGAYNKNEITSLGNVTSFTLGTSLVSVGKPLGSHYEVKWAGVDAGTGAPLYYTKDGKVTDVYSPDNRVQDFGTSIPPITGGFGTDVTYKGFQLSAFFSYAAKTYRANNVDFFLENPNFLQQGINQAKSLDFWQKPGDVASTQSPLYQTQFSSKLIQDASFLRLRNVTLSYNFSPPVLEKLKYISNIRLYLLSQNLFTWSKWKGLDPENDSNLSISEYPNPRAFTAGIDITF